MTGREKKTNQQPKCSILAKQRLMGDDGNLKLVNTGQCENKSAFVTAATVCFKGPYVFVLILIK